MRCVLAGDAATAASTLFESIPFILAGLLISQLVARRASMLLTSLMGCGCAGGPSARSLPAALLTALLFGLGGPARVLRPRILSAGAWTHARSCSRRAPSVRLRYPPACGRSRPAPPWGFLAIAGIFDLRAWRTPRCEAHHDGLAYALCSVACAIGGLHHGSGLVHPLFTWPPWGSAIVAAGLALRFRGASTPKLRWALALMLSTALLSTPPPIYRATETSMEGAFTGKHMDFTGRLTTDGTHQALVRYAITCCRAGAAPVVLRLSQQVARAGGTRISWTRGHRAR
ncbi:MAG: hypothetical protein DLM50_04860 [Candidatus Meridianibacter frigidus]|nr:MAG: hypothetical protein DLM50_04860 [Candidatus Eremiobacteraeota bacterium]